MKKKGRKKIILKNINTLLIIFVLISCNLSVLAITIDDTIKQNNSIETIPLNNSRSSQGISRTNIPLLEEYFDDTDMPPNGTYGLWEQHQTNPNETWEIDDTYPYSSPFCATVHRGDEITLQDEWLITPTLNFSNFTKDIFVDFQWYTCYFTSAFKRYIEFNVSVSIDGGANWTTEWCFNDNNDQFFEDWGWYYANYPSGDSIDISKYAGNSSVKIAFQYYSNTTQEAHCQEFSIDDIKVYAYEPEGAMSCDAGGPYNWWWPMQYEYKPAGVRFHGKVINGSLVQKVIWNFGDGSTNLSTFNLNPYHLYNDTGNFSITFRVEDSTGTQFAENHTTLRLYLLPPPNITVSVPMISLGIQADINYPASAKYNASYIHWWINITTGLLQTREKAIANETIPNIEIGTSSHIQTPLWFLGFGKLHILITVFPENTLGIIKHYTGWKFGPFVIIREEIPIF